MTRFPDKITPVAMWEVLGLRLQRNPGRWWTVDKNVHHVHLPGTNGSTDAENHDGVNSSLLSPFRRRGKCVFWNLLPFMREPQTTGLK